MNKLLSVHKESKAELNLLTGRRRMGKTKLIKRLIGKYRGVLLTCRDESEKLILERFSVTLGNYLNNDFIVKHSINGMDSF